jgi:hypothetical protein
MNEADGCALLRARFEAAGLVIVEHARFSEGGVEVVLDGYDAARRVGYEYITTHAGDRAEFTPAVVAALEARMADGSLALLLVDEHELPGRELLERAADGFLAELRRLGRLS